MGVWREKLLCRRMTVGGADPAPPAADQWTEGLWRYYYVTHDNRVCGPCLQRLEAGGRFKVHHRSRWAFVVLAAILALLVLALPVILPRLRSALWLTPADGR